MPRDALQCEYEGRVALMVQYPSVGTELQQYANHARMTAVHRDVQASAHTKVLLGQHPFKTLPHQGFPPLALGVARTVTATVAAVTSFGKGVGKGVMNSVC
jgi:hypothetical protein